ncbi:hypothetical protein ACHHYP_15443 [Achlya hypogyna]|uniref:FYVE-type domain-containing protein n=1 Tax=Achlya hypogyna TaxID=1202772 RepID=A0A1V9YAX0_ACHHY|nr:hypothetical protein ACHHYP_15443 [Achlya hypogyna]
MCHPKDFVTIPDVTTEDRDKLVAIAHEALSDIILRAKLEEGCLPWRPMNTTSGQPRMYTAKDRTTHETVYAGVTTLEMTLDDAIDFFQVTRNGVYFDHARLLARKATEACVLAPLSTPSFEDPYHYVDLPWFPCLERSHGLLRAHFGRTGYILTEVSAGVTQVVHLVNVAMHGNVPSMLVAKAMRKQAASVSQLAHRIRTRGTKIVSTTPTTPGTPAKGVCASCHTKLHCLKTKIECQRCGDIVCRRCILVNVQCKNCCYGHPHRVRSPATSKPTLTETSSPLTEIADDEDDFIALVDAAGSALRLSSCVTGRS